MNEYTTKQFWDSYYGKFKPHEVGKVFFADLFEQYLTPDARKSVLEIGCAGGDFLCYLAKRFQYQAHGVDFSDEIGTTRLLFEYNGLPAPMLYKENFFQWNPGRQFDIVCSFGFLEHFSDPKPVIEKHVSLLAPGGTLIITLPHFAHLQYFFHWLIDRENLKKHNTKIMKVGEIKKALAGVPLEIQYLNYFRTFGFWIERPRHPGAPQGGAIGSPLNSFERLLYYTIQLSGRALTKLLGPNRQNPFVSPHLVLIAKKIPS